MVKKILISVGVVLIVAAIVVGVLVIIKQAQPQQDAADGDDTVPQTTVADLSKDYGACNVVTTSGIKAALGSVADDIQEPQNLGIVGDVAIGPGVEGLASDSQLCVYAFTAGGTIEDGFNSQNALTIEVTRYTNEGGPTAFIEQIRQSGVVETIPTLGNDVFYSANTVSQGPGAVYTFKLQVFDTGQLTAYAIRQPADSATLTAETARAALITLAEQAKE